MTIILSRRITAISIALLLLMSSTGFSMDVHYCQDQLKSISFFGKAKNCHDTKATPSCHNSKMTCHRKSEGIDKAEKDNCCHNESIIIEKSDIDATSPQFTTSQDFQVKFVAVFVAVYLFNYTVETDFQSYQYYKPPLPDSDFLVRYQTFLI